MPQADISGPTKECLSAHFSPDPKILVAGFLQDHPENHFISSPSIMEPSDQKVDTVPQYLKQSHERIFENNRAWVATKMKDDPAFFEKLSAGQTPEYL